MKSKIYLPFHLISLDTKTIPLHWQKAKEGQLVRLKGLALNMQRTRKRYIRKGRKFSYRQHGPECCFQLIKNTEWRFKTQESQNCIIYTVPKSCPYSLIKDYFGRNHPPVLERKKLLENKQTISVNHMDKILVRPHR